MCVTAIHSSAPASTQEYFVYSYSICGLLRRHVDPAKLPPTTISLVRLFTASLPSHSSPYHSHSPLSLSLILFHCLSSDVNERAHFWLPSAEATATTHELLDSPTSERMYIDQGEIVRVRVETDEFYDDEPGPPKAQEGIQVVREARRPPYNVTVSFLLPPESKRFLPFANEIWRLWLHADYLLSFG